MSKKSIELKTIKHPYQIIATKLKHKKYINIEKRQTHQQS
jgi:hypothetical protein